MDNKFIKLINTVYRVLDFFPESDPLKNRAKDRALSIMDNLVLFNDNSGWASFQKDKVKAQILEDVEILLGYLWIAKTQGWLNSVNFIIISNEFKKVKKELGPVMIELTQKLPGIENSIVSREKIADLPKEPIRKQDLPPKKLSARQDPPSYEITARQRKILEFLNKNEKAQVMDLQKILPDITKRTIRRDLDELLNLGKIVRMGDFNQIFYKIKQPASI